MKHFAFYICIILPIIGFAQLGGNSVYEFVNTPYSARENAMGGNIISVADGDIALALKNPSLLDTSYNYKFSGSWGSTHILQTNIGLGSFGYAQTVKPDITLMGGIQFISYGKFSGYDEEGNGTGTFIATDYQIILGGSYKFFNNFHAGISIKPILSYLETYSSYGLLGDLGVSYVSNDKLFSSSVLARNIGTQLTTYTEGEKEAIPYSIDWGFTKRLKHAPFRFTITYRDLQKFDLTYNDVFKQQTNLINQTVEEKTNIFTNIRGSFMKHIQISSEVLLFKKINFLLGYNYRKSEEMSFGTSKKAVGFSFGITTHISYFDVSYGWSKQHVAGGTNYITLTTDIDKIYSKFIKTISL